LDLGEDEDPVFVVFHGREEVVEDGKLSAVADLASYVIFNFFFWVTHVAAIVS